MSNKAHRAWPHSMARLGARPTAASRRRLALGASLVVAGSLLALRQAWPSVLARIWFGATLLLGAVVLGTASALSVSDTRKRRQRE